MELALTCPNSILLADHAGAVPGDGRALHDQALLTAYKSGDQDAFAMLYRRHARTVFQFALYMAGNADTADEITQEVFVWLVHHPDAFDAARGTLPAFLGGVARKFLRRQHRTRSKWFPLEDAWQTLKAVSLSRAASLEMDSALEAGRLREAVALLPMRYREAIVLCDLQENDYAAAARIMNCSVGTVRSRLHRGRGLLARKLNPSQRQGDPDVV